MEEVEVIAAVRVAGEHKEVGEVVTVNEDDATLLVGQGKGKFVHTRPVVVVHQDPPSLASPRSPFDPHPLTTRPEVTTAPTERSEHSDPHAVEGSPANFNPNTTELPAVRAEEPHDTEAQ